MHQIDNVNNILRDYGERFRQERTDRKLRIADIEPIGVPLVLTLGIGALGIFLYRSLAMNK